MSNGECRRRRQPNSQSSFAEPHATLLGTPEYDGRIRAAKSPYPLYTYAKLKWPLFHCRYSGQITGGGLHISILTADQRDSASFRLGDRGAARGRKTEILSAGSGRDFTTLAHDVEALADEPQTVLTQFRARKARAQSAVELELNNAQADFARAYRDYRAFRIRHQLTETEPSYDNVFWRKVFWLVLLCTVEVTANGWIIGQASVGGLLQGWATALMISVLVVLTGFLLGAAPWRYLIYRGSNWTGRLHSLWALPSLVLGSGLLVLFAFYIAHYRYALSHTSLDAPVPDNILTSILSRPFQPFEQLEALLLFIIALLIGIFSIARGAHWDDPYPGYGPRHRRLEEARERAHGIALGLASEIDQAKDLAANELGKIATKSQQEGVALRQAIARTEANAAIWDSAVPEVPSGRGDAMELHPGADRKKAQSAREPVYFVDDAAPSSRAELLEDLSAGRRRATANITACKSQIARARAQVQAEYLAFYDVELLPFLKGIADAATVSVRAEFSDPPFEQKIRETPTGLAADAPVGALPLERHSGSR